MRVWQGQGFTLEDTVLIIQGPLWNGRSERLDPDRVEALLRSIVHEHRPLLILLLKLVCHSQMLELMLTNTFIYATLRLPILLTWQLELCYASPLTQSLTFKNGIANISDCSREREKEKEGSLALAELIVIVLLTIDWPLNGRGGRFILNMKQSRGKQQ